MGAALVLLALLLLPGAAQAQAEPALRVLILEGPGAEWLRRVRGQLSDLPVAISTLPLVVEGQAEADVVRQLGPLAVNRDAALVAWLITEGTRYDPSASEDTFVAIWLARSGHSFTRRLGLHWQRLSRAERSAVLEMAALSVRSAVRSLLLDAAQEELEEAPGASAPGGALAPGGAGAGQRAAAESAERAARAAEQAPEHAAPARGASTAGPSSDAEPSSDVPLLEPDEGRIVTSPRVELAPTPPPPADAGADGAAAARSSSLDWSAELGLSGQLAGPPGNGAAAIAGGLRAGSGRLGLALLGRFGLPARAELGPSELSLQRHALSLEAQCVALDAGALTLSPLARGGLALSRRETLSGPAQLTAAEVAWSRAVQLGAGALAQYRWGPRWGASLRAVLHWLPARTDYSLVDDLGDPVASARPWAVQPSLELNASWHW